MQDTKLKPGLKTAKPAGVYAHLEELVRLQFKAQGFSFLPGQPVQSLLAGNHASRLRGRGLDFAELRQYRPGDDIRTMDWKCTKRTGHAYVRVYTEEKERSALLIVDQRINMFFGSQLNMKSVTAAEVAALAAWRVFSSGDRVGAIVFNDTIIKEIRPQRSKKTIMQILKTIIQQNHALGVDRGITPGPGMLDKALQRVVHLAKHDFLICIASDFDGLTPGTKRLIKLISKHNDVIIGLIYDPLAKEIPGVGALVVSDGDRQIMLDAHSEKLRKKVPGLFAGRLDSLTQELSKYGVPIIPIHTAAGAAEQIRDILGARPGQQLIPKKGPAIRGSR